MIFSRAELAREAFGHDENWKIDTNGYRAHQLVWSLFSDHEERSRDFVFRWDTTGSLPVLHTVSRRRPVDGEKLFSELRSKPYEPQLAVGDRYVFQVRVNPVVKRRDDEGRQRVHDVVADAKKRDGGAEYTQSELVQRESYAWLTNRNVSQTSRADRGGFEIAEESFFAHAYTRHEFSKSRRERRVVIATVDLRGILEVTDVERFRRTLFEGLGPSKAFGCGLLMIRPVS